MAVEERIGLADLNLIPSAAEGTSVSAEGEPRVETGPYEGLAHAEALELELPIERYLIENLIPVGSVGTLAGLPETHKSFIAQASAVRVAAGKGTLLGCPVASQCRVGYFWQDDSTRSELERIQLFDTVDGSPADLPLWWFLNMNITLPDSLERIQETVQFYGLGYIILDSFYNFATGVDLKDSDAELLVALLKRDVADAYDCTTLIVDHMPWATETNRQRLRSYGGVFKGAATRFGIYIDAVNDKLWVEARGNNIVGFKRTPAVWDREKLELELVDTTPEPFEFEDYEERILGYLILNPASPTKALDQNIEGRKARLIETRNRLLEDGRIYRFKDIKVARGWLWSVVDEQSGSQGAGTSGNLFGESGSKPFAGVDIGGSRNISEPSGSQEPAETGSPEDSPTGNYLGRELVSQQPPEIDGEITEEEDDGIPF